ncbi:class II fumarate hydratase [Leptolyngbya sp. 15MV]|nr:class II fumarate hydratase [Leptolyngbya sp. 15MV]
MPSRKTKASPSGSAKIESKSKPGGAPVVKPASKSAAKPGPLAKSPGAKSSAIAALPAPTAKPPKSIASLVGNSAKPPKKVAMRIEKDTMGEMDVPADALYGASTQRAVLNFPVSGRPVPERIIKAYALIKAACATVNNRLGRLDRKRTDAIVEACHEIKDGLAAFGGLHKHFPVDVFQTGSGTSTNMNVNEVVANLVCLRNHKPIGSSKNEEYLKAGGVHPNDHVNMGQSSNDTFPTAMHVAAAIAIQHELLPAVQMMAKQLDKHAAAWDKIVKIGRTHLQDATPIRLGQEFSGFASQMHHAEERLHRALQPLGELPIGGTAVGTGINTHEEFGSLVAAELSRETGVHFREASNHFEAQHAKDAFVEASGHLATVAISITKIANDIRWLGSGPRCGLGELVLPAVQPCSIASNAGCAPRWCSASSVCRPWGSSWRAISARAATPKPPPSWRCSMC